MNLKEIKTEDKGLNLNCIVPIVQVTRCNKVFDVRFGFIDIYPLQAKIT